MDGHTSSCSAVVPIICTIYSTEADKTVSKWALELPLICEKDGVYISLLCAAETTLDLKKDAANLAFTTLP
jgi:hypothetical protein